MKLQVEQLKEQMGKKFPFHFSFPAEELGDVAAFPWSHHDITTNGEYWYDGVAIQLHGSVHRQGTYACMRCLAPVEKQLETKFEEVYRIGRSGDADEDDDTSVYVDGDVIDIGDLIRETLIINEPYQVLCQEDCKGLCVHCGANLNESQCSCDSFEVDPRFAGLLNLFEKK